MDDTQQAHVHTKRGAPAIWRGIVCVNGARLRDEQRTQAARVLDQERQDGEEEPRRIGTQSYTRPLANHSDICRYNERVDP